MQVDYRQPKPVYRQHYIPLLLAIFFFTVQGLAGLAMFFSPNSQVMPVPGDFRVFLGGEQVEGPPPLIRDGQVMLPVETVQRDFDPYLWWDENIERATITSRDKVVHLDNERLSALVNNREVELEVPLTEKEGVYYLPAGLLSDIYGFSVEYHVAQNSATIQPWGEPVQYGQILRAEALRLDSSRRAPLWAEVPRREMVRIYGEEYGWYRVQWEGHLGFLPKSAVTLAGIATASKPTGEETARLAWKPLGGKINLVWEQVVSRTPDPGTIPDMPGVNVVSPTWFHLKDSSGALENRADTAYVDWAHQRGYQVWALVTNGFDPDLTHEALADAASRQRIIDQIVLFAGLYHLDGINLDFENMHLEDKDLYVQFVRELVPLLHEMDLTVSADVTVKSTSANWSRVYDRSALAETLDYVMLMAYDQYPAGSKRSGPVASLPWTEMGLQGVLTEIPAEKLILGVPFYTRLWEEKASQTGEVQVSARSLTMAQARRILDQQGVVPELDEETGLLYGSYEENGNTYRVWLETEESMARRVALVREYNLAGMAAWRRGFEERPIWEVIAEGLTRRPWS